MRLEELKDVTASSASGRRPIGVGVGVGVGALGGGGGGGGVKH